MLDSRIRHITDCESCLGYIVCILVSIKIIFRQVDIRVDPGFPIAALGCTPYGRRIDSLGSRLVRISFLWCDRDSPGQLQDRIRRHCISGDVPGLGTAQIRRHIRQRVFKLSSPFLVLVFASGECCCDEIRPCGVT